MSRRFSIICIAIVVAMLSSPDQLLAQGSDRQPVFGDSQASRESENVASLMRALNRGPEKKTAAPSIRNVNAPPPAQTGNEPVRLEFQTDEIPTPLPLPAREATNTATPMASLPAMPIWHPPETPPVIQRVQAIEPLPAPPEYQAEEQSPRNGDLDDSPCVNCNSPTAEPSKCGACEELLKSGKLTRNPSYGIDVDDLDPMAEFDDWDAPDTLAEQEEQSRLLNSRIRPIQEIDFGQGARQLDKVTDYFEPQLSPNTTFRDPHVGAQGPRIGKYWTARNLSHRNLYFEDLSLERYGWAAPPTRQALLSAAEFLKDSILFPVRHVRQGKCDLHYVYGFERPGTCTTRLAEDDLDCCR